MDTFQSNSPVQNIAQEVATEEEEVSTIKVNVCMTYFVI